jgi:hypothetical protein
MKNDGEMVRVLAIAAAPSQQRSVQSAVVARRERYQVVGIHTESVGTYVVAKSWN